MHFCGLILVNVCVCVFVRLQMPFRGLCLGPYVFTLCLQTWVTDAIVEQGVQTHAELLSKRQLQVQMCFESQRVLPCGFLGWGEAMDVSVSVLCVLSSVERVWIDHAGQLHAGDIYLLCFMTETLSNMDTNRLWRVSTLCDEYHSRLIKHLIYLLYDRIMPVTHW